MTEEEMIRDEKAFYEHIYKNLEKNSFIPKYLFSGLADGRNFGGLLKNFIFKNHFYVESNKNVQNNYNEKINQLFNDDNCGILGIQAHGGSGKTTTIEMIETRLNDPCNLMKITVGFRGGDKSYIGAINRINKICKNFFLDKVGESVFYNLVSRHIEIVKSILNKLSDTYEADYDSLSNLWEKISTKNLSDLLKERAISNLLLAENNAANDSIGLKIAILFLVVLVFSDILNQNENSKCLIIFDNIECVTSTSIGDIIDDLWICYHSIFNYDESLINTFNKIKFIICARTTTGLLAVQNNIGTWGNNDEYIIDIENNEFCAEALLKKLRYLHDRKLKNNTLYATTRLICQLICGVYSTDKYLGIESHSSNRDYDYTEYAKKYLLPFFGNDYRLLVESICLCILDRNNNFAITKIKDLISDSIYATQTYYDISINGARNILWYLIFRHMVGNPANAQMNIFEYFGIQPIIEYKESHSITRIILSFFIRTKYIMLQITNGMKQAIPV